MSDEPKEADGLDQSHVECRQVLAAYDVDHDIRESHHLTCSAFTAVSSEAVDKDLANLLLLSIKANAQLKNLGIPSAVLVTLIFI